MQGSLPSNMSAEVQALMRQGMSRREAVAQIRLFESGVRDGFAFYFTNARGGQGILQSGNIKATRFGLAGPGVYAGTNMSARCSCSSFGEQTT